MSQAGAVSNSGGGSILPTPTQNGQLIIGPTPSLGFLTSTDNSVTVTNGVGSIDLSAAFNPLNTVLYSDDFVGNPENFWAIGGGGGAGSTSNAVVTAGHPGTFDLVLGSGSNASFALLTKASGNSPMIFGGGQIDFRMVSLVTPLSSNASNGYFLYVGFSDQEFNEASNGAYFKYTDSINSGRYQCVTANGGVRTATDSGVTVNTNYRSFRIIINAAGTSVSFFIDGVLVATNTTNIPTTNPTCPGTYIVNNGFASASALERVDMFYMKQILTTSR